jgi:hypothetical protein
LFFVGGGFFLFVVIIAGLADDKKSHGEEDTGQYSEENVHEKLCAARTIQLGY